MTVTVYVRVVPAWDLTLIVTLTLLPRLTLTVSDDGVGLPQDFQIDGTKSFGLAITRTLTAQLGGTLDIDSNASGTSVRVTFPTSVAS